ncbi:RNase E specificity factor CsrD [Parashewanella curva]|uniref:RNase E specificity factor CsrD n=1 Tax=Parashewanella curva TaxID=2338552 RepID=A0A3L8PSE1_9GAMM|nr:RNase E specificity factor CsrD [Parashewanella curva]RLV58154.1 RNase E specificity factor CsrD [Parashewanella curva]
MKLTRVLTKKLALFWLLSLSAVAVVFISSSLLSFFHLANNLQSKQVDELQSMLMEHRHQHTQWNLDDWLPPVLMSYNTVSFEVSKENKVLFRYQGNIQTRFFNEYQFSLDKNNSINVTLKLESPYIQHQISQFELILLLVTLGLIGLFTFYGYRWIENQLNGVEELAARGQMILEKRFDQALSEKGRGQPRIINHAMTLLLEELKDAHKERSRFDKYIRSNTFLDPDLGIGNRLYLKNRLAALSNEQGMLSNGVIYFLEMEDLDLLQQEEGEDAIRSFLTTCLSAIDIALQSQANSFVARRTFNQFAIVIPQLSLQEADTLAARILKICLRLPLPTSKRMDDFFHIGGAFFSVGDDSKSTLEEAEMALRAAQFQGNSSWFMYEKEFLIEDVRKGSVRWRSLLENAIEKQRFVAFVQKVIDIDQSTLYFEVFSRIKESKDSFIRASQYTAMAAKCGLMPQIDRLTIESLLRLHLSKKHSKQSQYCINLHVDSLLSESFRDWLTSFLNQQITYVPQLIFEVSEPVAVKHAAEINQVFALVSSLGAKISIDSVGQQVVGSQYLKEMKVNYVKLHRSIVRQIHLRPENQLFVRSLYGALYRTDAKIIAEGVEVFEEWQTLRVLGVSAGQGLLFSDLCALS